MHSIRHHYELEVYVLAHQAALLIFDISEAFPIGEGDSLADQLRTSSRAVYSGIIRAWSKRLYEGAFIRELSSSEASAAETQTWLRFAMERAYLPRERAVNLIGTYNEIIDELVVMISDPDPWLLPRNE